MKLTFFGSGGALTIKSARLHMGTEWAAPPSITAYGYTDIGGNILNIYWKVINNDELTATVWSGPETPPTYDSKSLAAEATSVQINYELDTGGFGFFSISIYAQTKSAGNKLDSTITAIFIDV